METTKRLIEFLFSPVGIMSLLFISGLLYSLMKPASKRGGRLLILGALLFSIYFFSPLAEIVIVRLESDYPPLLKPDPSSGDTIVVLSGYGEEHPAFPVTSNISEQTTCRIVEGMRLHQLLPESKLLISGGIVHQGDPSIASLMADFMREIGVAEDRIILEGASRNTYENMLEVKKIIGSEPFILVTSACDLRRAMAVARNLDMKPTAAPACIWALQHYSPDLTWFDWWRAVLGGFASPSAKRLTYLQWAYHEYLGYGWYWLLGRL